MDFVYHSTLGLRVMQKKKKKKGADLEGDLAARERLTSREREPGGDGRPRGRKGGAKQRGWLVDLK